LLVTPFFIGFLERQKTMSKFYSILLDDEIHGKLRKASYEQGKKMSELVRDGIYIVLKNKNCTCDDSKNSN
jgi:hypothetical protein